MSIQHLSQVTQESTEQSDWPKMPFAGPLYVSNVREYIEACTICAQSQMSLHAS